MRHTTTDTTMWFLTPTQATNLDTFEDRLRPITGPRYERRHLAMAAATLRTIITSHPPRRSGLPVTRGYLEELLGCSIDVTPSYPEGVVTATRAR